MVQWRRRLPESSPSPPLASPRRDSHRFAQERRHLRQLESKQELGDIARAKATVLRENGLRAADQPAREVDLTLEMQRKVSWISGAAKKFTWSPKMVLYINHYYYYLI